MRAYEQEVNGQKFSMLRYVDEIGGWVVDVAKMVYFTLDLEEEEDEPGSGRYILLCSYGTDSGSVVHSPRSQTIR